MDLEAMQLLNLSPIPELSELELSTMLDHLSGLSDVNGDLTDRNVEDILKEAEDLLDKSTSSKTYESEGVNKSSEEIICKKATESESPEFVQDVNISKDVKEPNCKQPSCNENQHCSTPVNSAYCTPHYTPNEDDANKHYNSPVESTPTKIYSPGGSCNHIKSTIDSLKEFSTLIEKKLTNQLPKSSPKCISQNEKESQSKEVTVLDSQSSDNSVITKQMPDTSKTVETSDLGAKKIIPEHIDKSLKLLNCFERLYQDRPNRLTAIKKPKIMNKIPKTLIKMKLGKDLKNAKKNNWQGKSAARKMTEEDIKNSVNAKIYQKMCYPLDQTSTGMGSLIKQSKTNAKYCLPDSHKNSAQLKTVDSKIENEPLVLKSLSGDFKLIPTRIDEKLMLKVLEEIEEIKDHVRKAGIMNDTQNAGEYVKKDQKAIESFKVKSDLEKAKSFSESGKSSGIIKLEEQLYILKAKYDRQMEKLEAENSRLKEALDNQQKTSTHQTVANNNISNPAQAKPPIETKNEKMSIFNSSFSSITEKENLEICNAPKNSPCSSSENVQTSSTVKEAFSQTEKELKSTSVQCSRECALESKEIETNQNAETVSEMRKIENKENLAQKKILGRSKPFSDIGGHQSTRQKKVFDHESQLFATLRGLQSELSVKEKENRKLRTEIDSLRRQLNKLTNTKVESCRKSHVGTQTVGLGPSVQKPYYPENYEVPDEFEKENEELRSRIKTLEEDFELLKEKRINDLQSLHQVHEEEMAKLVSKLETQSALTRHLHSLLVNR